MAATESQRDSPAALGAWWERKKRGRSEERPKSAECPLTSGRTTVVGDDSLPLSVSEPEIRPYIHGALAGQIGDVLHASSFPGARQAPRFPIRGLRVRE
jgi:hypothetical protein